MNKFCIFFTLVTLLNNVLAQSNGNDEDDRGGSGKQLFPNQWQNQFNPSQVVSGSNLPGNQFPTSTLPGASPVPGSWGFPGNQFPGSQFQGSQFPGSQLPGSQFPGSQFPGSQFPGSQFPGSQFPGSQFPGSQFPGTQSPGGINQLPGGNQISSVGPDQLNIQNIWQRPTAQRTTEATPTTTPDSSSSISTQSPATRQCLTNCLVTPEYNPVCGSDNVTYDNLGRLSCAQTCGINVTLARNSRCSVLEN